MRASQRMLHVGDRASLLTGEIEAVHERAHNSASQCALLNARSCWRPSHSAQRPCGCAAGLHHPWPRMQRAPARVLPRVRPPLRILGHRTTMLLPKHDVHAHQVLYTCNTLSRLVT